MKSLLKKTLISLNKVYHVDEFLDNSVVISFEKDTPIFAMVIMEDDIPDTLLLSVALNAPDTFSIADVTLRLIHLGKVQLAEPFLVQEDGDILWGEDAYHKHAKDNVSDGDLKALVDMESPGKLVN